MLCLQESIHASQWCGREILGRTEKILAQVMKIEMGGEVVSFVKHVEILLQEKFTGFCLDGRRKRNARWVVRY